MIKSANSIHTLRNGTFASRVDGSHVSFRCYSSSAKPNKKIKHIIIQHGAVEYHRRHMDAVNALIKKYKGAVIVSCMDLVGHGYSGGTRAYTDSIESYVQDFLSFSKVLTDIYYEHEVESTHVIAHSLGGMVALKAVVDHMDQLPFQIDSMILTNPCFKTKIKLPEKLKGLIENVSGAMGKARVPSLYSGKDLTTDLKKAISFDGDHLISDFITTGMMNSIIKASSTIMSYSYYLRTPTLFILSGQDKLVDNEATKLFIGGVDKSLVKTVTFPDAKHDILNETCASQVFQEIIEFIEHTLSVKRLEKRLEKK